MALDQVTEQHGAPIFLVDLDPQHPAKACNLGKATAFPVLLECLLDGQTFFGREWTVAFDPLVVEKLL